jgi:NAD(P)-dependent dehydrogenase (short-subunit alcohol dehydrogenase family)
MEMARRGYGVVVTARTAADVEAVAREVDGVAIAGDVTDDATAGRLVDAAVERFGRLDAVVNNAGYAPLLSVEQVTRSEWQRVMETNLGAAFRLRQAAWGVFRRQGGGVIVNVSSAASRDPFPGLGVYGAAKAGLNVLGLALAREGEAHGIRVHTIAPSATETEMFRGIMSKEQAPPEKVMAPEDVALVIAGCVSGELRYTSGEVIYLHRTL